MKVERAGPVADGIVGLTLRPEEPGSLPDFAPGAHIDLNLPNGLVRSYSLLNDGTSPDRYEIAVSRDAASRGGSTFVCDTLRAGDTLMVAGPRNNFPLAGGPTPSVLIAGGIGITPIYCMVRHLAREGRPWTLHYSAATRPRAAFLDELAALGAEGGGVVTIHIDAEAGGRFLDIGAIVGAAGGDAHFYCCGPAPMLDAFVAATAGVASAQVHLERFTADEPAAREGGFTVELAATGVTLEVEPGKSILDTVLDAGIDVPFSCTEGTCGTCETRVIEGIPDHRDAFLTPDEQAGNTLIMICCSGSKTLKLVLDL